MVKRLTPVLFVKEIEPVLPFWVEGLGFTKTTEVPEGNKLGFVILEKDGVEVMYQTYASADKDLPSIAADVRKGATFLYVQVDSLEAIKAALKRAEVYMPERKTFYGATEIGLKDPAGHFITSRSSLLLLHNERSTSVRHFAHLHRCANVFCS